MNRFPVAWTLKVAVPETRRLSASRFDQLLATLRAAPIDAVALRLQGWILVAALVVPFVVVVAAPFVVVAGIEPPLETAAVVALGVPLIGLSIYGSRCLFSLLNAVASAAAIRERLAAGATATA